MNSHQIFNRGHFKSSSIQRHLLFYSGDFLKAFAIKYRPKCFIVNKKGRNFQDSSGEAVVFTKHPTQDETKQEIMMWDWLTEKYDYNCMEFYLKLCRFFNVLYSGYLKKKKKKHLFSFFLREMTSYERWHWNCYSHAFRETDSLRRPMQTVKCSLLCRRAQGRVSS